MKKSANENHAEHHAYNVLVPLHTAADEIEKATREFLEMENGWTIGDLMSAGLPTSEIRYQASKQFEIGDDWDEHCDMILNHIQAKRCGDRLLLRLNRVSDEGIELLISENWDLSFYLAANPDCEMPQSLVDEILRGNQGPSFIRRGKFNRLSCRQSGIEIPEGFILGHLMAPHLAKINTAYKRLNQSIEKAKKAADDPSFNRTSN